MAAVPLARRVLAAFVAVFGLLGVSPARADHTSVEPGGALGAWYQEYGFPGRGSNRPRFRDPRTRYVRDRCDDACTAPYRLRYGGIGGTPWVVMRNYLVDADPGPAWHRHPECWFVRRWLVPEGAAIGGHRCEGLERPIEECALSAAALAEGPVPEATEERLLRGLERFRRGRPKEAAEDFRAATEADPKDPRALYGTAVCAFATNRWAEGAKALRALAHVEALDAKDRLDTADAFEDPSKVASLLSGLRSYAHWSFHDADAQLVLGWALVATGRPEEGRRHLKSVLRFRPDDPAARRLLAGLDAPPAAPPR